MRNSTDRKKDSPREKLISTAERLFLKEGYHKVSIRMITEQAGANVAAVNYHFGSKENLYREVVKRMIRPVTERRLRELDEATHGAGKSVMRRIVRAYVAGSIGDVLSSNRSERCMNLLSKEMSAHGPASDVIYVELVKPVHGFLRDTIKKLRPELDVERISLCISSIVGQVIHFIRSREMIKRIVGKEYDKKFVEKIIEHITDFSVKGI